jgi:hypothetical protein
LVRGGNGWASEEERDKGEFGSVSGRKQSST